MPPLKAGHINDFSNSMAEAIEIALRQELAARGEVLPAKGEEDRRMFFVAISRGVLQYLKDHQAEMLTSITLDAPALPAAVPVLMLDLNYFGS
jgi:hypothetical protein